MAIDFNKLGNISNSESKIRSDRAGGGEPAVPHRGTDAADAPGIAATPEVTLSTTAQALTGPAAGQAEIDMARVEQIRAAIAEGRYHVDPVRLAENFVNLESQLSR